MSRAGGTGECKDELDTESTRYGKRNGGCFGATFIHVSGILPTNAEVSGAQKAPISIKTGKASQTGSLGGAGRRREESGVKREASKKIGRKW